MWPARTIRPTRTSSICNPEGRTTAPVIVSYYGGGLTAGDKTAQEFIGRRFAAAGFVTAVVNYRLTPDVQHPGHIQDAAALVRRVKRHIAEDGGNGNQVFVIGHSAGAYLAALLATDERYLRAQQLSLQDIRGVVPVSAATGSRSQAWRLTATNVSGEGREGLGRMRRPRITCPPRSRQSSSLRGRRRSLAATAECRWGERAARGRRARRRRRDDQRPHAQHDLEQDGRRRRRNRRAHHRLRPDTHRLSAISAEVIEGFGGRSTAPAESVIGLRAFSSPSDD